ncbi:MAG: helix-turn-helix domain-containing protein [Ruminococcaceae bacterium]|nr:helix-turn-helix domain-containing protein [Oscillospiraceae bacterium]
MLITDREALKRFSCSHRVWQGIPGIERTKGGRTFITFYSGATTETYGNYVLLYKSDNEREYELVAAIEKPGKFRCFDPVLWIDPLQRLWFVWNVMPGEEVYGVICEAPDAEELVWGERFYIGRGIMMNKPTVLTSGEWLFPIAIWPGEVHEKLRASGLRDDDDPRSYVYKTADNGKSFVKLGGSAVKDRRCDEHMVLELKNGVLAMYVRTRYGIAVSYSYDRGMNWSRGEDSGLKGPCSRFYIGRLASGRVLLVNHVNFTGRNNLTALLSEDDGKTFPYSILLDERNGVSYPDVAEKDGYIYITYDRERGCNRKTLDEVYTAAREILVAKINEGDIINGSLVSEQGFLKRIVSKLGRLLETDRNPFEKRELSNEELAKKLILQGGNVIEESFALFPFNCTSVYDIDVKKVESLIKKFEDSGNSDEKLLAQIISIIRAAPKQAAMENPIIDVIKNYIEEHITEDFLVSELAEKLNISVYYLCHMFKAVTGITVTEYCNSIRITNAKHLLIRTDETVNGIAQKCGFCTAAYFSEVFVRLEKISPSEYRRIHKKEQLK